MYPCILFVLSLAAIVPLSKAQQLPDGFTVGTDGPADAATLGFWTNHIGLNVGNLTASKEFYGDILGMRHIFTIQFTESYSETYMGFSQGGKNGTGYQTGAELLRDKNNSGGLVKLMYFKNAEAQPVASTQRASTLANLGLIVPDRAAAQERLEKHGVKIVKKVGSTDMAVDGPIANAFGIGPGSTGNVTEAEELLKGLIAFGVENIIFAEDPDGNMLEIMELNDL